MKEKPSGSDEEGEGFGHGSGAQPMDSIEYTSKIKVEKIGDLNPVQDFEAMMSRRDSPEWVNKAIKYMKDKIFELVENSCEGDVYQKAVECLVALRKGCILEQVNFALLFTLYVSALMGYSIFQLLVSRFPKKNCIVPSAFLQFIWQRASA